MLTGGYSGKAKPVVEEINTGSLIIMCIRFLIKTKTMSNTHSLTEVMTYIRKHLKAPDAVYSPTTKTIYVDETHHDAIKNKFPNLTIKLKHYD